jgi:Zn-dependent protease
MREQPGWTVSLGRWKHVQVRLHLFVLLAVVCTLYLSWLAAKRDGEQGLIWISILSLVVLAAGIAAHVIGHLYAAMQLEERIDGIVLGPLGDFASRASVADPRAALLIAAAGPAMNLLLALACAPLLWLAGGSGDIRLLHPLSPSLLTDGSTWVVALKLGIWINWMLAIVNLLPAYPFDGGPMTHAIVQLISPQSSPRRVRRIVARVGMLAAAVLLLIAVVMRSGESAQVAPPWLVPLVLATIVFCSALQEPARENSLRLPDDDSLFGYDFSQGYTSLARSEQPPEGGDEDSGPLERWLDTRREARRAKQEQIEAEEDALVDEILARVHERGMHSLSLEERSLLERAAARYRTRENS